MIADGIGWLSIVAFLVWMGCGIFFGRIPFIPRDWSERIDDLIAPERYKRE